MLTDVVLMRGHAAKRRTWRLAQDIYFVSTDFPSMDGMLMVQGSVDGKPYAMMVSQDCQLQVRLSGNR
jgi:hypothetical protein